MKKMLRLKVWAELRGSGEDVIEIEDGDDPEDALQTWFDNHTSMGCEVIGVVVDDPEESA